MTGEILLSEEEALEIIGYKNGEKVSKLWPHINRNTKEPCGGETGTVFGVDKKGLVAYVECDTCKDVQPIEL